MKFIEYAFLMLVLLSAVPVIGAPVSPPGGIPIKITLPKASLVTVVIEDAQGRRVRNLIAETPLPAGKNTIIWDGYDEGTRSAAGDLIRHRVAPGRYSVRGLTHGGIHLRYEFAVNSPGSPPWFTVDHRGGWMADHLPPTGAVFLPKGSGSPYSSGESQVFLSSLLGENGEPLIFVDTKGRKLYGDHFFGWDGAVALARDQGTQGRPDVLAYVLYGFETNGIRLRAVTKKRGTGIEIASYQTARKMPHEPAFIGLSLAVYNSIAAVSLPLDNCIAFFDTRTGKALGTVPVDAPKGLWFDPQGKLYAIIGTQVRRYSFGLTPAGQPSLSAPQTLVTSGLEEPHSLTQDRLGNLYVADWGQSHQVKVFTSEGVPVRVIGRPGGPQLGHYDDHRMQHPLGVAVDDQGQLWVAEFDNSPRRISVWNTDGTFVKAFYGGPQYGGGGTIDAYDPTRFFYAQYGNVLEYRLDWKTGTSRLENVCLRPDLVPDLAKRWVYDAPERAIHIGKNVYLIGTYNGGLDGTANTLTFKVGEDGVAWPVSFIGGPRWWQEVAQDQFPDVISSLPPGRSLDDLLLTWSDLNRNHRVDPDEIHFRLLDAVYRGRDGLPQRTNYYLANTLYPDLSMTGAWTLSVAAPKIDAAGIPVYDLNTARFLMPPRLEFAAADFGMTTWKTASGWDLLWAGTQGWKNGVKRWTYPQFSQDTIPEHGGHLVDATRLMGPIFTPRAGEAGEMFARNGNKGSMYLMTTDGLFLQTLGGDERVRPLLNLPTARRGMLVDGYSFRGEDFHNSITQTVGGQIYVVAGHEFSGIFHVEGLETVRRRQFARLDLPASRLAALPATQVEKARRQVRRSLAVAVRLEAPPLNGDLSRWPASTQWAPLDRRASAAVLISGDSLYAAWKTGDPHALSSGGGDYHYLFKRGGALDLMLGTQPRTDPKRSEPTEGDLRLLVTQVGGQTRAVLYRPVVPGTDAASRFRFLSPVGEAFFDQVTDVSRFVTLAQRGGDYEIRVPLSVLGFAPTAGQQVLGDLGLLRGDGSVTTQRLYWNNLSTQMVSDVPTEARLSPADWGQFTLVQP